MRFFNPIEEFTHYARFYRVPCYLRFDENGEPTIAGTNIVFDWLLLFMTYFHNYVVEFGAQALAYILDHDYEPGFPIMVWEMEREDEIGNEN
jgi:hypothetical protein